MRLKAYITHKKAERFSDCADYFGICPQSKRVAVSDGVSQSIMPLEWAKILVEAFLNKEWSPNMDIAPLKERWLREAMSYLEKQKQKGINPWMLENCLTNRDGAGATFCGITFDKEYKWTASILGDSCLVIINDDNQIKSILSSKEGSFGNRPDYYDSFKEQCGTVKTFSGDLQENQKLFLVSDPFSELFQKVQNSVKENEVISKLLCVDDFQQYLQLVEDFRNNYQMHNDDSTFVVIEYDGNEEFRILDMSSLDDLIETELQQERIKEDGHCVNDWQQSLNCNTVSAHRTFLQKHPKGCFANEAEVKLQELNLRTSDRGNANGDEDTPESSSEDSDISGQECKHDEMPKQLAEETEKMDTCHLQKLVTTSTELSSVVSNATIQNNTEDLSNSTEAKVSSTTSICGDSENETILLHEEFKISDDNQNQDKIGIEPSSVTENISIPPSVDASDGIDQNEFKALLPVAQNLFKNYIPQFKQAFTEPGWREKHLQCFEEFWVKLETIIYNNHG